MSKLQDFTRIAIHAKQLFVHACSHASSSQMVDQMIALHDMHNAVEWLLAGMWGYYYASTEKPFRMMDMFDRISQKQALSLKREIGYLNEARNQAQHRALAPGTHALERYAGYCEAFLRQSMRDLDPECEYDELFMGLLLPEGLTFRLNGDGFPARWIQDFKGRLVPSIDRGDKRQCILLDLRAMVIEAERVLAHTRGENQMERSRAARLAMNILAECLLCGQTLAILGLERPSIKAGTRNGEGSDENSADAQIDVDSDDSPLLDSFRGGLTAGFGAEEAVEALKALGYGDEPFEWRILSTLESLVIGIDQKQLWRFRQLLAQANRSNVSRLQYCDLLSCYDFVLHALLDLVPLIESVSAEERVSELMGAGSVLAEEA